MIYRFARIAVLALTAASAGSHRVDRSTRDLDFHYEWPAEAVVIPALDNRLYRQAKRDLAQYQSDATKGREEATTDGRNFMKYDYAMDWKTAGQSTRLLSLQASFEGDTGGAHPEHGNEAILWDRLLGRQIAVEALFPKQVSLSARDRTAYCRALNVERKIRREGETLNGDFASCPKFSELAIAPIDNGGNGRFEDIAFVASPYVAGPYVEGSYEIRVPVTTQLISAMKPAYRASFEVHRQ